MSASCAEPGCTGVYEDGYCNVCGSPEGAPHGAASGATAVPVAPVGSPSAMLGTGVPQRTAVGGTLGEAQQPDSVRTSSARLASAAIGSARTGSATTRRVGTSSRRLRTQRLGAGLTTVPPVAVSDPLQSIMTDPQVPESKRYCPSCGGAVGRSRDGAPGRTSGFCPGCGIRFDFDPRLTSGDVVGGQYEVVGCLAHGGLGWIYLARDRNVSGRWVVLKGLLNAGDSDAVAAAIAERQYLAEVEHPLIVEIYNFATHEGAGYTVMEYVGGKSLKQILTARRDANGGVIDPLAVDQAIAYVLEVLPAFAYLHDHGLLYCDFKPDNVIQQGEGVKLIDLGGVRRIDDETSAIFGTIGYQAPEVPQDGPSVASDIYTIGRTLATLVLDFRGNTTTYVDSLPPISETAVFTTYDSFYRLLAKACAPEPEDRFGTVDELRVQLLGVLREVVATDRGQGRPATSAAVSALFEAPVTDVLERPLAWSELPGLHIDPADPMASFLAGINVADPAARLSALAKAPEASAEVHLARGRAAIEARLAVQARAEAQEVLALDPWDWRGVWLSGLVELALGDVAAAQASFNAVYGQVPGELAPKLALAATCERGGELDIAESLYVTCVRTDANYAAPAAFGLARIRQHRGDLDGVLRALDLVAPTRGSYGAARLLRSNLLASSGRGLVSLSEALAAIEDVSVAPQERADLRVRVYSEALELVGGSAAATGISLGGVATLEPDLRDALEQACRDQATFVSDTPARVALIDRANAVRRWTWT